MSSIPVRDSIVKTHLNDEDLSYPVVKMRIIGIAVIPGNPPDSVYHFHVSLDFCQSVIDFLEYQPLLT